MITTNTDFNFKEAMRHEGLYNARMLNASKSRYRELHPNNEVYFNANIFTTSGKEWYGDIDLTLDSDALQRVSNATGEQIAVLREMDGRFEYDDLPFNGAVKKAVRVFKPIV